MRAVEFYIDGASSGNARLEADKGRTVGTRVAELGSVISDSLLLRPNSLVRISTRSIFSTDSTTQVYSNMVAKFLKGEQGHRAPSPV